MTSDKQNIEQKDADYEVDTLTNDNLLSDHEYDGIRELNNDMPSWWKWLFIVSIAAAILYMVRLWVFKADDLIQKKEYEKEMANARANAPANRQGGTIELKLLTDAVSLASGKETWTKTCAVCHLADGGGLVGPNMTDHYWIHGNKVEDLFHIVEVGVIEKGMISYKDQLSAKQRLDVVSYILVDLVGSTPATPKAPQGDLYE